MFTEMVADSKLDLRHHVEEEMTKALIRVCPNKSCARPTIKEAGCNKMTCGACRTLFCYVCAAIVQDYSHFDQQPDAYHKPKDSEKCPLWEDLNGQPASRHVLNDCFPQETDSSGPTDSPNGERSP